MDAFGCVFTGSTPLNVSLLENLNFRNIGPHSKQTHPFEISNLPFPKCFSGYAPQYFTY